ncbi:MAG: PAS domain-containing protein [Polaromonas sp.]|nr:PAS domain-containing protein [Polaromonas sp.]
MKFGSLIAHSAGLQARMGLLVLISLLPVFFFAIYASIQNQRERLQRTNDDLLAIARSAAQVGESRIEGTRQLLNGIASGPSLKRGNLVELCPVFLANIRKSLFYTNLGLLDTEGKLLCSAMPAGAATDFGDRAYFKDALATRSFVGGDYQVGRITDQPSMNFGIPVNDDAGALKGIAFAALDITRLDFSLKIPLPPGVELTVTDRNGIIIGTAPSQGKRIGEALNDPVFKSALQSLPDEAVDGTDMRGVRRIYAVTTVGDSVPGNSMYVMASIARSAVVAPIHKAFAWTMLMIAALTLVGLTIARWIGHRAILEPTQKLLQKVNALAGKDVTVPATNAGRSANEIVALTSAFERMTDELKARDHERDQGEAALRATQERLLTAQRIGHIGNWECDVKADEVWWSAQTFEIYGMDPGDAPGRYANVLAKVYPADRPGFEIAQKKLWEGGRLDLAHRIVLPDGRVRWVHRLGEASFDADGKLVSLAGTVQDITEQRIASEALQRTQRLLTMATRISRLGAWQVTLPERMITWSDEVIMIYELPPGTTPSVEEAINYYAPESIPLVTSAVDACINQGTPMDLEAHLITAQGNLRTVRVMGGAVRDQNGEIVRIDGTIQDVTERRAEQTQLQLLQTAVSRLNDIVLITEAEPLDAPGPRIVFVNDAFERRTGYKPEEVIGKTPRILQGPQTQKAELARIGEALRKWQPVRSELINYTKSGELFWLELDIVPITDATGRYTHWVAVERDITARKQAEEELTTLYRDLELRVKKRTAELQVANQELEAFSYSVSHDLRSPLNTIAGFGQLLEKMDGANISPKGKHYLSRIRAGAKQMGELIEGMLALAQVSRGKLQIVQVNLSALARQAESSCRERDPGRQVEVLIQDDLVVAGEPRLLLAALENLIGNAWKFTSLVPSARVEFFSEQDSDGRTCFVVRDNGAGFDMQFADKLFDTFQRLHAQTEFSGTGVGLTIVKRVVEKHGGRIWATSKVGEGATFSFTLGQKQSDGLPTSQTH